MVIQEVEDMSAQLYPECRIYDSSKRFPVKLSIFNSNVGCGACQHFGNTDSYGH